jgi:hypothetical protein
VHRVTTLRALLSTFFVLGSMSSALLLDGCSSKAGDPCKGGIIVDGVCTAKCSPELCAAGNICVNNACVLECASHMDCAGDGSQTCQDAKEDGTSRAVTVCGPSPKPGLGAPCPVGNECPEGLVCHTTGVADADAYCTNADCTSDADCLDGFYCGVQHDPHGLCGSTTIKGNNNLCGKTTEPCIAAGDLAAKKLIEGPGCLLRQICIKRDACVSCTRDLDCSRVVGQRCGDVAGEKHCVHTCGRDADCPRDAACVDGSCIPRGGACKGTGKFCDACVDDRDCGPNGTVNVCTSLGDMRACFDVSFKNTCTTDADCPASPSGLHGMCLDKRAGLTDTDDLWHHCYLPQNATSMKYTCW